MNAKARKRMLASRDCACISIEHCCETISEFRARMRREAK